MRTDPELKEAREATARGSKSFYFATRFFPPRLAAAAYAVYWFCRTTDDIVDEQPDGERARRELDAWRSSLLSAFAGKPAASSVIRLFHSVCVDFRISSEYPLELIEGMRMDLDCTRYESFDGLRLFCYRAASTVGLMMSHVIGFEPPALRYAEELGIAMQLTNILRDLQEDAGRGRIYLPAAELRQFGYSELELQAGVRNEAFRALMQFQIARAREHYNRALPGIALLRPEGRFAVEIAAQVYSQILERIESMDYDVFSRRAVVPAWRKYSITARAIPWTALWRA